MSATGSSGEMSEYLNRTGSAIVILTLIFLAIIMSTQFSFGRFFGALFKAGQRRRPHASSKRLANGVKSGVARNSVAK